MAEIVKLQSVSQYNALRGVPTLHPLVTLVDLSRAKAMPAKRFNFGVYAIFLKEQECGELRYGRRNYDYQEGTLVFLAPGQVVGIPENRKPLAAKGWALLFHPDFIKGTSLGKKISSYSFFSYEVNEALHTSAKERQVIYECFVRIQDELQESIDKHSKLLVASTIELLLNYCTRFYERQFITRDHVHKGVLEKFEQLLNRYFEGSNAAAGVPTVSWCAGQLHLSANYFGDLVKKETGQSAQDYIRIKLVDFAKERMMDPDKSISEVAYELGFKYPQHFTRLFKQWTGMSPAAYRGGRN